MAGPYDFRPMNDASVRDVFAPVGDAPAGQAISFARRDAPALLLLAGDADTIVKPRNTLALAARMRAVGAQVTDTIYPGVGHIGLVLSIAPWFQGKAQTVAAIEAFIAANHKK